ncbi:hypothetical protein ACETU7_23180 [Rhodococcus sp. 3Y1]
MKLEDEAGWLVLRFHHADAEGGWRETVSSSLRIRAGQGRRMTVTDFLPEPSSTPAAATGSSSRSN